jgi:hypothetical protein
MKQRIEKRQVCSAQQFHNYEAIKLLEIFKASQSHEGWLSIQIRFFCLFLGLSHFQAPRMASLALRDSSQPHDVTATVCRTWIYVIQHRRSPSSSVAAAVENEILECCPKNLGDFALMAVVPLLWSQLSFCLPMLFLELCQTLLFSLQLHIAAPLPSLSSCIL